MIRQKPHEEAIDRRGNPFRSMARRAVTRVGLMVAAGVLGAAGFGYLLHAAHHGLAMVFGPPVSGLIIGAVLLLCAAVAVWLANNPTGKMTNRQSGLPTADAKRNDGADILAGTAFALAYVVARQWSSKSRR
jgi:Putative Actinobacterial Holin-X, holin superfamily III